VPIEVLSNQASKKPRTINNALKMQRIFFFHKIHDIKNELLIIIHVDKNKCSKKKDKFFSRTKPRAFAQALYFETKGHLMMYFHQRPHFQTQEQIISFPIPRSCKISKANCFQFISKQFLLSKGKIKISRFILDPYSFTK
jgi:hypothetical protein